jgi:hypothetical protein
MLMEKMMEERRRSPRYDIVAGELALLPFSITVEVLDISADGVLLQSNRLLGVGARGCLRLTIGGEPVAADIEVRRVSPGSPGTHPGYRIGATFVGLGSQHRQVIERFTHP